MRKNQKVNAKISNLSFSIKWKKEFELSYGFAFSIRHNSHFHVPKLMEIILRTFRSEFSTIEIWFTDQNPKPLETENRVNVIHIIST